MNKVIASTIALMFIGTATAVALYGIDVLPGFGDGDEPPEFAAQQKTDPRQEAARQLGVPLDTNAMDSTEYAEILSQLQRIPGFLAAVPVEEDGQTVVHVVLDRRAPAGLNTELANGWTLEVHEDVVPQKLQEPIDTIVAMVEDLIENPPDTQSIIDQLMEDFEATQEEALDLLTGGSDGIGPGSGLVINFPTGGKLCSASFLFADAAGMAWLATAGHCLLPDSTISSSTSAGMLFPDSIDICVNNCIMNALALGEYQTISGPFDSSSLYAIQDDPSVADDDGVGWDFGLFALGIPISDDTQLRWGLPAPLLNGHMGVVNPVPSGDIVGHFGHGTYCCPGAGEVPSMGVASRTPIDQARIGIALAHGASEDNPLGADHTITSLGWITQGDSGSALETAIFDGEGLAGGIAAAGTITHSISVVGLPLFEAVPIQRGLDLLQTHTALPTGFALVNSDGTVDTPPPPPALEAEANKADPGAKYSGLVDTDVAIEADAENEATADSFTCAWTIESNAVGGTGLFGDATQCATTFSGDVAGEYTIKVTVDDGASTAEDTELVELYDDCMPEIAITDPADKATVAHIIDVSGTVGCIQDPDAGGGEEPPEDEGCEQPTPTPSPDDVGPISGYLICLVGAAIDTVVGIVHGDCPPAAQPPTQDDITCRVMDKVGEDAGASSRAAAEATVTCELLPDTQACSDAFANLLGTVAKEACDEGRLPGCELEPDQSSSDGLSIWSRAAAGTPGQADCGDDVCLYLDGDASPIGAVAVTKGAEHPKGGVFAGTWSIVDLDTRDWGSGKHTLTAELDDGKDGVHDAAFTIEVTVDNCIGPKITILSPTSAASLNGKQVFSGTTKEQEGSCAILLNVNAGSDVSQEHGQGAVAIAATVSGDPELTCSWTGLDEDDQAYDGFTANADPCTGISVDDVDAPGVYRFQLTASDANEGPLTDEVQVTFTAPSGGDPDPPGEERHPLCAALQGINDQAGGALDDLVATCDNVIDTIGGACDDDPLASTPYCDDDFDPNQALIDAICSIPAPDVTGECGGSGDPPCDPSTTDCLDLVVGAITDAVCAVDDTLPVCGADPELPCDPAGTGCVEYVAGLLDDVCAADPQATPICDARDGLLGIVADLVATVLDCLSGNVPGCLNVGASARSSASSAALADLLASRASSHNGGVAPGPTKCAEDVCLYLNDNSLASRIAVLSVDGAGAWTLEAPGFDTADVTPGAYKLIAEYDADGDTNADVADAVDFTIACTEGFLTFTSPSVLDAAGDPVNVMEDFVVAGLAFAGTCDGTEGEEGGEETTPGVGEAVTAVDDCVALGLLVAIGEIADNQDPDAALAALSACGGIIAAVDNMLLALLSQECFDELVGENAPGAACEEDFNNAECDLYTFVGESCPPEIPDVPASASAAELGAIQACIADLAACLLRGQQASAGGVPTTPSTTACADDICIYLDDELVEAVAVTDDPDFDNPLYTLWTGTVTHEILQLGNGEHKALVEFDNIGDDGVPDLARLLDFVVELPPLEAAIANEGKAFVGRHYQISGSATGGVADRGYTCFWSVSSGLFADEDACETTVQLNRVGIHTLTLTVTDDDGEEASVEAKVQAVDGLQAVFVNPAGEPGEALNIEGFARLGGEMVEDRTCKWSTVSAGEFGDGESCKTTVTFEHEGAFDLILEVEVDVGSGPETASREGVAVVSTKDVDSDGVENNVDNCPATANEADADGVQADQDGDGIGDECDDDVDGDGIIDVNDNCPTIANRQQADLDEDGVGDACDNDIDGDGVPNLASGGGDNCPTIPNGEAQEDSGDPLLAEAQSDADQDGIGDACDGDLDGDGCLNAADAFPFDPKECVDTDGDGVGDNSDDDIDGDGVMNDDESDPGAAQSASQRPANDLGDARPIFEDEPEQQAPGLGLWAILMMLGAVVLVRRRR